MDLSYHMDFCKLIFSRAGVKTPQKPPFYQLLRSFWDSFLHTPCKKTNALHMRDTLNGVSRITLFACGEFYCYAVIFGLRRVIFATRVFRRIEYHCEAKPCNITSRQGNITLCISKEYHYYANRKRENIFGTKPICSLFLFAIRVWA